MGQDSHGSRGAGSSPHRVTALPNLYPSTLPAACESTTRPCELWPPDASRQRLHVTASPVGGPCTSGRGPHHPSQSGPGCHCKCPTWRPASSAAGLGANVPTQGWPRAPASRSAGLTDWQTVQTRPGALGGLPGRLVCDRKSPVPPPGISTQALSPRKEPDSGELGESRAGQGKSKTSSWEHHVGPKVRKRSENSRMGVNAEPAARCPLASAAHRRPSVQQ